MDSATYELDLPRENIHMRCFAHNITNYRYHWHPDEYELSILLCGKQAYCRGSENYLLTEDDVILTAPGNGHASLTQEAGTRALVLHFSAAVFKPLVKKGIIYQFPSCRSGSENRMDECYRLIRFYVSQIFRTVQENSPYAQLAAKAQLELLAICLCTNFEHTTFNVLPEDVERRAIARRLLGYVEEHYASKLTLEDLADYAQYNRTYISTLFKQMVGINFHEYLTRVRFQHALNDLAGTHDNLTDIALRNGFADLKTFNARFRTTLQRTPAEYRAQLCPERVVGGMQRKYLPCDDPLLQRKLREYLQVGKS